MPIIKHLNTLDIDPCQPCTVGWTGTVLWPRNGPETEAQQPLTKGPATMTQRVKDRALREELLDEFNNRTGLVLRLEDLEEPVIAETTPDDSTSTNEIKPESEAGEDTCEPVDNDEYEGLFGWPDELPDDSGEDEELAQEVLPRPGHRGAPFFYEEDFDVPEEEGVRTLLHDYWLQEKAIKEALAGAPLTFLSEHIKATEEELLQYKALTRKFREPEPDKPGRATIPTIPAIAFASDTPDTPDTPEKNVVSDEPDKPDWSFGRNWPLIRLAASHYISAQTYTKPPDIKFMATDVAGMFRDIDDFIDRLLRGFELIPSPDLGRKPRLMPRRTLVSKLLMIKKKDTEHGHGYRAKVSDLFKVPPTTRVKEFPCVFGPRMRLPLHIGDPRRPLPVTREDRLFARFLETRIAGGLNEKFFLSNKDIGLLLLAARIIPIAKNTQERDGIISFRTPHHKSLQITAAAKTVYDDWRKVKGPHEEQ